MNVEDLRKLKAALESKKTYVPISRVYAQNNIVGLPVTKEEILAQEDTDRVVKECEVLIEKAVIALAGNHISFDHLEISSELGFFIRPEYIYKLKELSYANNYYADADEVTEEEIEKIYRDFKNQVFPNIVPVSFSFNLENTGENDGWSVGDTIRKTGLDPKETFKLGSVIGVVNWELFAAKMKELGYKVEFMNYSDGDSFEDYVDAVINEGDETEIDIRAEFGTTKKNGYVKK